MNDDYLEIKKNLRKYLYVGGLLFFFTFLTVAVASFPFLDFGEHGFDSFDLFIGLLIALVKASLVACIFMHLNHEKKMIYWIITGALFFAFCLFFITALAYFDFLSFNGFYLDS